MVYYFEVIRWGWCGGIIIISGSVYVGCLAVSWGVRMLGGKGRVGGVVQVYLSGLVRMCVVCDAGVTVVCVWCASGCLIDVV